MGQDISVMASGKFNLTIITDDLTIAGFEKHLLSGRHTITGMCVLSWTAAMRET